MARTTRDNSGALGYLRDRYVGDDPARVAASEAALTDAKVARDISLLRTRAGLSRRELAERVGTTASVIGRLEDADDEGHSLGMLRRVAAALGRRVEVRFPPASRTVELPKPAARRRPKAGAAAVKGRQAPTKSTA
jgi:transcriptional regulator with XRE-family HTH domain